MKKFEVQEHTICDGWVNTWHEYDDDNNEVPMTFDSFAEAVTEAANAIPKSTKETWDLANELKTLLTIILHLGRQLELISDLAHCQPPALTGSSA